MKYNFYCYMKTKEIGIWLLIDNYTTESGEIIERGVTIFPLDYAQMLDERLNEAQLVIMKSKYQLIKPLTEIKIKIVTKNDGSDTIVEENDLYFIVADDKAYEMPVGSGYYKHTLYLIERTKLLEGIYCQTLKFSNTKGTLWLDNSTPAIPMDADSIYKLSAEIPLDEATSGALTNPQKFGESFEVPSLNQIGNPILQKIKEREGWNLFPKNEPKVIESTMEGEQRFFGEITIESGTSEPITYTTNPDAPDESRIITLDSTIPIDKFPTVLTIKYQLIYQYKTANDLPWVYKIVRFYYVIEGKENKKPTKLWTITDCINRVLDLAEPIFKGETPRFKLNEAQAQEFDKILAPEFSMTQCTLREQLKIIGGFINSEPRLDENNIIYFDEFGTTNQSKTVTNKTAYIKHSYSQDINEYCDKVETSAQNIVNSLDFAQGVIFQPSKTQYLTLRTDTINVRVEEGNGKFILPFPINRIGTEGSVKCGIYNSDGSWNVEPVDISGFIFEKTEYDSNLNSYTKEYPYSKSLALYFEQGKNYIDGLFYKVPNATGNSLFSKYAIVNILEAVTKKDITSIFQSIPYPLICFQVSYVPIYSVRFSHGKQEYYNKEYLFTTDRGYLFSKVYNQSENLIETRYYGENVKGVAQRLGQVEQVRTYYLNKLSMIPKIGDMIDDYCITAVNVEITYHSLKCQLALSKDFNRISEYIGINSNKRVYEVDSKEAYKRDILLKDIVVATRSEAMKNDSNTILIGLGKYMSIFKSTSNTDMPVNVVISRSYNKKSDVPFGATQLPVVSSAFGNAMVFNWNYKDNYSAGEQIIYRESGDITGYFQNDVPYGDFYGRAYYHEFRLLYGEDVPNLNKSKELPRYSGNFAANIGISSKQYLLRKDSREALLFNYEIETQTTESDIIIGSALPRNCSLVTNQKHNAPKVYFFNEPIGKFQNTIDITKAVAEKEINEMTTYISFDIPENKFVSWAIVSEQSTKEIYTEDDNGEIGKQTITSGGEIIMASNKSKKEYGTDTQEKIHFCIKRG